MDVPTGWIYKFFVKNLIGRCGQRPLRFGTSRVPSTHNFKFEIHEKSGRMIPAPTLDYYNSALLNRSVQEGVKIINRVRIQRYQIRFFAYRFLQYPENQ